MRDAQMKARYYIDGFLLLFIGVSFGLDFGVFLNTSRLSDSYRFRRSVHR
jgi:hypothetical protein